MIAGLGGALSAFTGWVIWATMTGFLSSPLDIRYELPFLSWLSATGYLGVGGARAFFGYFSLVPPGSESLRCTQCNRTFPSKYYFVSAEGSGRICTECHAGKQ